MYTISNKNNLDRHMSDMIVPSLSLSICVAWERTNFVVKMRRPGEREQNIQQFLFFHSKRNETINIRFRHTHKHTSILYVDTRIKKQIIPWDRETICFFKSRKHFQSLSLLCFCLFILLFFFRSVFTRPWPFVCACVYIFCVSSDEREQHFVFSELMILTNLTNVISR